MTTPETNSHLHHNDDSSIDAEGFLERMRTLFEKQKTAMDRIQELASMGDAGKSELDTLLDDLAYDSLVDDGEFMNNLARLHTRGISKDEDKTLRSRQKVIFDERRKLIAQEAGLPDETALSDIEIAQQRIASLLEASSAGLNEKGVLRTLGILTLDDQGKEVFTYPADLFPESTDKKWEIYLEAVRQHLRKARDMAAGRINKHEVGDADNIRRLAHNAVAKDVHDILGLEELPSNKWNFEATREMLAKMRDSKFPTVETAERKRTEDNLTDALTAVKALTTRLSDLRR